VIAKEMEKETVKTQIVATARVPKAGMILLPVQIVEILVVPLLKIMRMPCRRERLEK